MFPTQNFWKFLLINKFLLELCDGSKGNFSYTLVNGVPQGCVLSPMLICVYIKYLLLDIDSSVFRQGYADDLVFGSRYGPGSINKLQRTLNSIHQRATSLGVQFDIGVKKSIAMWISLNKNIRKPSKPLLKLDGKFIPWTSSYKCLGVLLDNRLTRVLIFQISLAEKQDR